LLRGCALPKGRSALFERDGRLIRGCGRPDDGRDQDLLSDGCVRIATLNDLTAEWTGGIFDASGTNFYVSIQHNISGEATVIDITGWDV
jgi:hypothetical protein